MAVRVITLGLLIGLSLTAFADTLTGKVGRVVDGDTLYVLDANHIVTELFIRSFRLPTAAADSTVGPPYFNCAVPLLAAPDAEIAACMTQSSLFFIHRG